MKSELRDDCFWAANRWGAITVGPAVNPRKTTCAGRGAVKVTTASARASSRTSSRTPFTGSQSLVMTAMGVGIDARGECRRQTIGAEAAFILADR